MDIFIDTANVDEIKNVSKLGIIDGVTTNPSLIAKEGKDLKKVIEKICSIVNGPVNAEVLSLKAEDMIVEARDLSSIHKNVVIKIPMSIEGLKAVNALYKEGIKTNVTLVFSAQQALLAAKAGASYVSPFIGRLDDVGNDGIQVVKDTVDIFNYYNIKSKVIAASIRSPMHVLDCSRARAHIATIPYKVIMQMMHHPLTDLGIDKFIEDYKNF